MSTIRETVWQHGKTTHSLPSFFKEGLGVVTRTDFLMSAHCWQKGGVGAMRVKIMLELNFNKVVFGKMGQGCPSSFLKDFISKVNRYD